MKGLDPNRAKNAIFTCSVISILSLVAFLTSCGESTFTPSTSAATQSQNLGMAPPTVDFGQVLAGGQESATVTLTNAGSASLSVSGITVTGKSFSASGLSLPLDLTAGKSYSFNTMFAPQAAGSYSGNLSVVSNASPTPQVLPLEGVGVTRDLSISPSSLNFGNVAVGGTGTQTVALTNSGTTSMTISAVNIAGAGFGASGLSLPLSLGAGQTVNFSATFSPTAGGSATGSVSVTSDASNSPTAAALTGVGVVPQLSATPASINFGSVVVGTSSAETVTVTNTGTSSVTVTQANAAGTGFSISGLQLPLTLASGQSSSFEAIFTPTTTGSATGNVSLVSNALNSPTTVSFSGTAITLQLSVSPATITFGNVETNSTSTQSVTLANTGTGAVTVTQASVTGAGFSASGLALPLTLASGQSAALAAAFSPSTTGSETGTLSIGSNASNSPSSVTLSGTGVTFQLSAAPSNISFGDVSVGGSSSQAVTLTNNGTASVTVTQANVTGAGLSVSGLTLPLTLAGGRSAGFSVVFAPASTGSITGSVSMVSNASNSPTVVSVSGTGGTLELSASPSSLNFGSVTAGSKSTETVALTNNGTDSVTISQATLTGTGFSASGLTLPVTLAAGQSTSLSATFSPTSAGSATGNISVVSTASNSPTLVSLSGAGTTLELSASPGSVGFGDVTVGVKSTETVTLTNSGTGSVTISQANVTGSGFSVSGLTLPVTLASGQSANLSASFSPTLAGSATGSISVVSDASNSPASIALSGTGVTLQLSASPASVSFGNVSTGTINSQTVTLTNTGTGSVTVTQANVSGTGFSVSGLTLPATLAGGQNANFSATFSPTSTGSVTGSISIVSNASNSPASVALSGTGVTLQLSASPSTVNFGNVIVNNSSSQSIVVTNTGTASVTINSVTASGTGFSISGITLPVTLGANQNTSFNAVFSPTATGSGTGTVAVASTASNSPNDIALSGDGVNSHTVSLTWTASTSPNISGYNVYRGTVSGGPYSKLNSSFVAGTSYTDTTPLAGNTYYYVVTAVNSSNIESTYSIQASADVPTP